MPSDDFLKQFLATPPDDFASELLDKLNQAHNQVGQAVQANDDTAQSTKSPIVLVPSPRSRYRNVDRYITSIASIVILIFVSAILVLTIRQGTSENNLNSASVTLPIADDGLSQLIWTPDGNTLYVATANQLYRLDSRLQLLDSIALDLNSSVTSMIFINNGEYLILGDSRGMISIWSTETHEHLGTTIAHNSAIQVLTWLESSQRLLSASQDSDLVVFDVRSHLLLELDRVTVSQSTMPMFISGLTVHPNGHDIIATMNNTATFIYQLEQSGRLILSHDDFAMTNMPPSLQASYHLTGEQITYVWWDNLVVVDSHTLSERYRYPLPEQFHWLHPLQMSQDGRRVLLTDNRSAIALWDYSSESYIPVFQVSRALNHDIHSVLHPNGRLVAAIMESDEVHLWQINTLPNQDFDVVEVAVNRLNTNQTQAASAQGDLRPINANTIGNIEELFSFGDGFLTQTLWTPDGSQLIVTSTSTIRIYDAALNLQREWSLIGNDVVKASLSDEGRFLVTASSTGTIVVWDVATGRMLSSLSNVHETTVSMLAFLGNRNRIVSRETSGVFVLLYFDGSNLQQEDRFESAALSSYQIADWHFENDILRFLMIRDTGLGFSNSEVINIVDFDLQVNFEATSTTTAISGTLSTLADDGKIMLVYDRDFDTISAYDSYTFELQSSISMPDSLESATHMKRDILTGQIMLTDYDKEFYIYDYQTEQINHISADNALFEQISETIAIHPNQDLLAIIVSHNRIILGEILENGRLSQIASDTPVLGQIQTFITGPTNVAAASTTDGSLLFFDTLTGNLLRRISLSSWGTANHDLAFNATGTILVQQGYNITGFDSIVNIIDVQAAISGEDDVHLSDSPYIFEREYLSGLALSSQDNRLITGGSQVRIWNLNDEPFEYSNAYDLHGLTIFTHNPQRSEVATLRPGNYLRVVSTENMFYRYSTRTHTRSTLSSTFLDYLPDGSRIIMASSLQAPEIYDAETGELIITLSANSMLHFSDMTLSQDGSYLLLADRYGLFMWDINRALVGDTEMIQLPIDFAVDQVAVTADGLRLLLVGHDGTIHVMGIPRN